MMTQKQHNDTITSLNNLRDYLVAQHLCSKDLEYYIYDTSFMGKTFNVEEAIDVVLKHFNHMNKADKHKHAPIFNVVVKSLCNLK